MLTVENKPLKKCRICGLEANNQNDLIQFVKDSTRSYQRTNTCKKCHSSKYHPPKPKPNYLRKCRKCGLEAKTSQELELFTPDKACSYGRKTICKYCLNKSRLKPKPPYLRKCRECGLIALTEEDLELFSKSKQHYYGRAKICKECENAKRSKGGIYFDRVSAHHRNWRKKNPHIRKSYQSRSVFFGGKHVLLEKSPRTNICTNCGRRHPQDLKYQTVMHHWFYDEANVLAGSVEICNKCHPELPKARWTECEGDNCTVIKYDADLYAKCPVCGEHNPIWDEALNKEYIKRIPQRLLSHGITV